MNSVAIFLILLANLVSAIAIVITRRAGKSEDINLNLNKLTEIWKNHDYKKLMSGLPKFAINSILYNKYIRFKVLFSPVMIGSTYFVYAGGYMSYITIGLTLQPIFTGALSHLWLKELPSRSTIIGAIIMTIGGIWLFTIKLP